MADLLGIVHNGCGQRMFTAALCRASNGNQTLKRADGWFHKHAKSSHAGNAMGHGPSLVEHYASNLHVKGKALLQAGNH